MTTPPADITMTMTTPEDALPIELQWLIRATFFRLPLWAQWYRIVEALSAQRNCEIRGWSRTYSSVTEEDVARGFFRMHDIFELRFAGNRLCVVGFGDHLHMLGGSDKRLFLNNCVRFAVVREGQRQDNDACNEIIGKLGGPWSVLELPE